MIDIRYSHIKIYKTQQAIAKHCVLTGCRKDAMVRARLHINEKEMDVRLCLQHAAEGGITS